MDQIDGPRPFYEPVPEKKKTLRLEAGSETGGIVVDVTRNGLVINGYYKAFQKNTKYANTLRPVKIAWRELEKAKESILSRKEKKKKVIEPDRVENRVSPEYLESLPVVTINNSKYYIDGDRRERRPVKNPKRVFKY